MSRRRGGTRAKAMPEVAPQGRRGIRDHGGDGPPVVLVPSLINPPQILDLDADTSLAGAIAGMGRRALLLDWGEASRRVGPECRGPYRRIAAAVAAPGRRAGRADRLLPRRDDGDRRREHRAVRARRSPSPAPWHFARLSGQVARGAARTCGPFAKPRREALGALPMEVLQAAFWSLDPERTVRKFADFGRLDPDSAEARRFVALEEWANRVRPCPSRRAGS